jgi:hypothetical protein
MRVSQVNRAYRTVRQPLGHLRGSAHQLGARQRTVSEWKFISLVRPFVPSRLPRPLEDQLQLCLQPARLCDCNAMKKCMYSRLKTQEGACRVPGPWRKEGFA